MAKNTIEQEKKKKKGLEFNEFPWDGVIYAREVVNSEYTHVGNYLNTQSHDPCLPHYPKFSFQDTIFLLEAYLLI